MHMCECMSVCVSGGGGWSKSIYIYILQLFQVCQKVCENRLVSSFSVDECVCTYAHARVPTCVRYKSGEFLEVSCSGVIC